MKYAVVTTFNQSGYQQYGSRMLDTWLQNWPKHVDLWCYAEQCTVTQSASNLHVMDIHQASAALVRFKQIWGSVPKARGDITGEPHLCHRKDRHKHFKWDAVRFAHKVYAVFDCAARANTDWLLWMDADMVCHSAVTLEDLHRMCPDDRDLCYLGRRGKYSECGLYAMNLRSGSTQDFLREFQRVYDDAESGIFLMQEWHDSFVFDQVRQRLPLRELDWSQDLGDLRRSPKNSPGEGHPLINSEWGRWLDHLKGDRKTAGRSDPRDLRVTRSESYWSA
jgi:hypothetical protein